MWLCNVGTRFLGHSLSPARPVRVCVILFCDMRQKRVFFSPVVYAPGTTTLKHHRRCEHSGCTKWPLYAFEGEKAKYCSQHKVGGEVAAAVVPAHRPGVWAKEKRKGPSSKLVCRTCNNNICNFCTHAGFGNFIFSGLLVFVAAHSPRAFSAACRPPHMRNATPRN